MRNKTTCAIQHVRRIRCFESSSFLLKVYLIRTPAVLLLVVIYILISLTFLNGNIIFAATSTHIFIFTSFFHILNSLHYLVTYCCDLPFHGSHPISKTISLFFFPQLLQMMILLTKIS